MQLLQGKVLNKPMSMSQCRRIRAVALTTRKTSPVSNANEEEEVDSESSDVEESDDDGDESDDDSNNEDGDS